MPEWKTGPGNAIGTRPAHLRMLTSFAASSHAAWHRSPTGCCTGSLLCYNYNFKTEKSPSKRASSFPQSDAMPSNPISCKICTVQPVVKRRKGRKRGEREFPSTHPEHMPLDVRAESGERDESHDGEHTRWYRHGAESYRLATVHSGQKSYTALLLLLLLRLFAPRALGSR